MKQTINIKEERKQEMKNTISDMELRQRVSRTIQDVVDFAKATNREILYSYTVYDSWSLAVINEVAISEVEQHHERFVDSYLRGYKAENPDFYLSIKKDNHKFAS